MAAYTAYVIFNVDQEFTPGVPWRFPFQVTNNGTAVDLTGCTVKCGIKVDASDTTETWTPTQDTSDFVHGNLVVSLTKVQTKTAKARKYIYDLWLFDTNGIPFLKIEGNFNAKSSVSIL